ncbi:trypsin-like serine peptidase [Actinoplanes sp. CA-054009]
MTLETYKAEAEIIGPDDRRLVTHTLQIPFRFVCCLAWEVVDTGTGKTFRYRGTGTLISDRHVLTAAHNVLEDYSDRPPAFRLPIGYVRSRNLLVAPARNDRDLPGDVSTVRAARVAPRWQATADRQAAAGNTSRVAGPLEADFALLTLDAPLGARLPRAPVTMQLPAPPLGWWGHRRHGGNTRIRAYDPAWMRRLQAQNVMLNVCGYPVDKCRTRPPYRPATAAELAACTGHIPDMPEWTDRGSTQWVATGRLVEPARPPGVLTYDADTAKGHSGSPIWLNWQGYRNLVAIHTGAQPGHATNRGVPITDTLLHQLRVWMRADRVQPGF